MIEVADIRIIEPGVAAVTLKGTLTELNSPESRNLAIRAGEGLIQGTCGLDPASVPYRALADGTPCETSEQFTKWAAETTNFEIFHRRFVVRSTTLRQTTIRL